MISDELISKMKASAIYLGIFTKNYEKDLKCAMEFGLAMMLNKPIYFIIADGIELPENVKKVTLAFEHFDYTSARSASDAAARLLKRIKI